MFIFAALILMLCVMNVNTQKLLWLIEAHRADNGKDYYIVRTAVMDIRFSSIDSVLDFINHNSFVFIK